ncbi:HAF repeat-containing PEP-CTERM protein [Allocoleopsis franciscana]|uniref:PEP-CTERM putative exosortase interaction domain-containing protein,HAF family repeat protein n=1 Tax=Allocoleopsis franciscana PCC 7113 TaxID=1173027 RepID=K9WHW2_9CYAN|nr:HAF repeat-containing PEP-CTERM protein [Allocoleopsis franciscana]AFZ19783.1 PEP-CTERM putative exosortase interaction domain-containing protein,HAF family repeat protein [Allocoleopsis franciscana PCC 7113]
MNCTSIGQKLSFATATVALLALGSIEPAAAISLYSITELPFVPTDINDKGQIVGSQYLWESGTLTELGFLPGANATYAKGINNVGQVVGSSGLLGSSSSAFIWQDGIMSSLGTPPASICTGCYYATANDINDQGQIVGDLVSWSYQGFVWANGTLIDTLAPSYLINDADAINNAGQVIVTGAARWSVAFVWNNGTLTALDTPQDTTTITYVKAKDINNAGQVVGSFSVPFFVSTPRIDTLLWDGNTGTILDNIDGNVFSANSINDSTLVVGESRSNNSTTYASIWEDGELFDLNTLIPADSGWELVSASKINNKNQIVGTGKINGESRGFLLTPEAKSVPEPTSVLGVLGLGGLSMVLSRLRKRKWGN